jgi:rubrerythrin
MLDSESQLREAIQKMLQPGGTATTNEHGGHGVASTNAPTTAASTDIAYICPMPEHVALKYPKPGKCPLCGMALVPVTAELLAKIQPGGRVEHYTCPMPEHSDVKLDKPGKCPRCSMTLIPMMPTPQTSPAKAPAPEGHQH